LTFPASTAPSLGFVLANLQGVVASAKAQAQNALASMQAGQVNTLFIFSMLDQISGLNITLSQFSGVVGLNAYATAQITGYAGTLTADISAVQNAGIACITWVTANFPVDSGGFIQAFKLNADGTRVPTAFTNAQTAGLQTLLQAFINTIG